MTEPLNPPLWVIQKLVRADSLKEAVEKEATGEIVEVTKVSLPKQQLEPAIGFQIPSSEARLLAEDEE